MMRVQFPSAAFPEPAVWTNSPGGEKRYIDSARRRTERIVAERTAYLISFFREHPCGKGLRERPWKDVLAEIEKCDVVCANCHRRRTNRRGGFIRSVVLADTSGGASALVACGGPGDDSRSDSDSSSLVNWPLFGRVPERTHYLPDEGRDLDPPLRQAWSINTHALIEFPPALAGGVAYVANKYGGVRAVRLRNHEVIWERATDHRLSGPPTFVTAPVYHHGRVFLAFLDGDLVGNRRGHR